MCKNSKKLAFSLVELVIVVVIIAIIGAIAIPRMSRGAAGAADSALIGDLKVLRTAVDLYANEHGGTFPGNSPSGANVANQLTLYTDDTGNTNSAKTAVYIYGPYLRVIPSLPVGAKKGQSGVATSAAATTTTGWIYDATNGTVTANTTGTETDAKGIAYSTY